MDQSGNSKIYKALLSLGLDDKPYKEAPRFFNDMEGSGNII